MTPGLRFLLQPVAPEARARNPLLQRIAAALARPQQTRYTCPTLMTVTALAHALRGYDVEWTAPRLRRDEGETFFDSSRAQHVYYRGNDAYPSHAAELRCLFPNRVVLAEFHVRGGLQHWTCLVRRAAENARASAVTLSAKIDNVETTAAELKAELGALREALDRAVEARTRAVAEADLQRRRAHVFSKAYAAVRADSRKLAEIYRAVLSPAGISLDTLREHAHNCAPAAADDLLDAETLLNSTMAVLS